MPGAVAIFSPFGAARHRRKSTEVAAGHFRGTDITSRPAERAGRPYSRVGLTLEVLQPAAADGLDCWRMSAPACVRSFPSLSVPASKISPERILANRRRPRCHCLGPKPDATGPVPVGPPVRSPIARRRPDGCLSLQPSRGRVIAGPLGSHADSAKPHAEAPP